MVLRETPPDWRRGFDLYRRRTERDTLGRETAHYAQEPDVRVEAADGLAFQHPRTGERMEVECPLPDYFQEVLRKLSMRK